MAEEAKNHLQLMEKEISTVHLSALAEGDSLLLHLQLMEKEISTVHLSAFLGTARWLRLEESRSILRPGAISC